MEIISFIIGLIGIFLSIYFGIRSQKDEKRLKNIQKVEIEKRILQNEYFKLSIENENNKNELCELQKRIENLNIKQNVFFDPRSVPQSKICPKCEKEMLMDDIDYFYVCNYCSYEEYSDSSIQKTMSNI